MRRSRFTKAVVALTLTATLLIVLGAGAQIITVQPQPAPGPEGPAWVQFIKALITSLVELVKALAWPIAAIVIALVFRKPLGQFLGGLASRVTKLSVFDVALELGPASAAVVSPLLDDIRSATIGAAINDSSRMLLEQAQSNMPADYAVINLGAGEEWITSRLFIAAVMLERMRGVQVFVFLENSPAVTRRFVAVAPLAQVRWSLAQRFPWLEAAWVRAYLGIFPAIPPQAGVVLPAGATWLPDPLTLSGTPPRITSPSGGLEPAVARQVVAQFIESLQRSIVAVPPPVVSPPPDPQPSVKLGGTTLERASYVTRALLESLLPQDAFDLWADSGRDAPRVRRTRGVLRRPAPFVALVEGDREFVRLVNRRVLLEEIAASIGEEPEAGHA